MNNDHMKILMGYVMSCDINPDCKFGILERLDPIVQTLYENQLTQVKPVSAITSTDLAEL